MSARFFRLVSPEVRRYACEAVQAAPDGYVVKIQERTRSLESNAAMWAVLQAFADQLQWPVNGAMTHLTAEEWKEILSAAFHREHVRIAQGLDGGVVMLGKRTSKFSVREMSEFLEFLNATAAARDVDLSYREHADEWKGM